MNPPIDRNMPRADIGECTAPVCLGKLSEVSQDVT